MPNKALRVKSNLRVGKRRGEIKHASNKSLDVRAKQRLYYQTCVVTSGGLGGGFAPRQFNR